MSALFAQLIMQHTNMALIFLGQTPHPQTGKPAVDLDHARFFIDQLEMIEVKTKGNLDKTEEGLLRQSLTHLRLAYVEAASRAPAAPATAPAPDAPNAPPTDEEETPIVEPKLPGEKSEAEAGAESKKMFSKKYS